MIPVFSDSLGTYDRESVYMYPIIVLLMYSYLHSKCFYNLNFWIANVENTISCVDFRD